MITYERITIPGYFVLRTKTLNYGGQSFSADIVSFVRSGIPIIHHDLKVTAQYDLEFVKENA